MSTSTNTLELNTTTGAILRDFSHKHRLKTSRDECGELIVRGQQGQIYEHSDSDLGVLFSPNDFHPRRWSHLRKKALAAGLRVVQDGDGEGAFVFDRTKPHQAKVAIKIAGVRKRRLVSQARREQLLSYLAKARTPCPLPA